MVTSNSDLIANTTTVPPVNNPVAQAGGRMRVATGWLEIADSAFDAADDVIRLCTLPSNAVIHNLIISADDMDGGTDSLVDIGLYNTGDASAPGDVILIDAYADNSSEFRDTNVDQLDFRFTDGAGQAQLDLNTAGDALWENAALTSDPGGLMEVVMTQKATVSGDEGANTLMFRIVYTVD